MCYHFWSSSLSPKKFFLNPTLDKQLTLQLYFCFYSRFLQCLHLTKNWGDQVHQTSEDSTRALFQTSRHPQGGRLFCAQLSPAPHPTRNHCPSACTACLQKKIFDLQVPFQQTQRSSDVNSWGSLCLHKQSGICFPSGKLTLRYLPACGEEKARLSLVTERSSAKDRAELMAGKSACSNSVLEVLHGFYSDLLGRKFSFSPLSQGSKLCYIGLFNNWH